MHLIGCDFHTRFQQIAMVVSVPGEILNRRLKHGTGEAQQFLQHFWLRHASGWKPPGEPTGLSGCSQSSQASSTVFSQLLPSLQLQGTVKLTA